MFVSLRKIYVVCSIVLFTLLMAPFAAQASETNVVLNSSTLQSGYTVHNTTGTFQVGIRSHGTENAKNVRVHLRKGKKKRYSLNNQTLLSDVHVYSLKSKQKFRLTKKVWIKLSYPAAHVDTNKVIKYWDSDRGKWRKLKTQDNPSTLQVSAALRHKTAVLGVFEKPEEQSNTTGDVSSGIASFFWYDGGGAASNDFPMNTRIRVTNTNTGAFVDTTVISTGPFVPGRIVDLTDDDFQEIASLSTGVIPVTVQRVE